MSDVPYATLVLGADATGLLKGKEALEETAKAGAETEKATNKTGDAFKRTGNDAAAATPKVSGMSKAFSAAAVAAGALLGALAAGVSLNNFVSATIESEKAQAQLAATILSTGGAAGKSIAQLNENAAALQKVTNFGDDATNAMQGLLLTFTNIKGDQFDAATAAVLDLSTAMGSDLKSAALQVGKALNDPAKGMAALAESGIQFTEAQKSAVTAMLDTNNIVGAQTIILGELERQFGGSAEAARGTLGGALESLGNSWGDLFEIAGPGSEALRASVEKLITTVSDPAFVAAIQAIGSGILTAVSVSIDAITTLSENFDTLAVGVGAAALAYTSTLIPAIVAGVAGLGGYMIALGGLIAEFGVATVAAELFGLAFLASNPVGWAVGAGILAAGLYSLATAAGTAATAADIQAEAQRNLARDIDLARDSGIHGAAAAKALAVEHLAEAQAAVEAARANVLLASHAPRAAGIAGAEQAARDLAKARAELAGVEAAIRAARIQIDGMSGGLSSASGQSIDLSRLLAIAAANGVDLSVALGSLNMTNVLGQPDILAARLGVALDVAIALNSVLNANAGINDPSKPYLNGPQGAKLAFGLDPMVVKATTTETLKFASAADIARMNTKAASEEAKKLSGNLGGGGGGVAKAAKDAAKSTNELADEIKKLEFDANPALKYNEQLEHLNELAANGLSDGAYRKAVKDLNDEFAKSNPTINKVGDAIGNFVASGLKDFKGLLSAFKNMIREMIATAIANPIRLALTAGLTGGGATGAAAQVAGGGAGGGGILAQIGGIGSSFVSGASGLVTALTGAGGGLATAGTYLSSVLGGATSSIAGFAAAAGAIALPLAAVAAVFSFFKTKTKELDTGMRITASSASILVEDFKRVEKSKFWGLSKKVKTTYSDSKNADPVEQAIDDIKNSGLALGSVLGLTAANFASFSSQIQISLKGLSDDQAKAEIARALGVIADQFSYAALGSFQVSMGNVIKDGETASAAMERLVSSLIAVNDVASLFGRGMIEMSVAGGVAASALVDLVGGLDAFNSKSAYVFSNMLTSTEQSARKVAIATEQLNAGFAGLGVSIPKTHAQYMALMNAQNLMTESGRNTYAALLDMSAAFVEVNGTAQSAAQAAADLSQQASTLSKDIDTVNRTLSAMSRPIFDVTTAGRAMSASLVALMGGLDAFTSATSYFVANFYSDTEQLAISTRDLAAQFAAIGVAVPASKEAFRALVNAQDLTTASGQALYAQLMALAPAFNDVSNATAAAAAAQAKAAADAKAAAAAQKAAAAQAKATAASKAAAAAAEAQAEAQRRANEAMQAAQKIADERRGLEDRYYEAIGDTVTMRNREVAALDASNQAFGRMVMQLEDAKKAADALNEGDFASQVAFNLARARAYGQIASAPTPSASYGGNVVPITPTTTTPTTTDPGLTALDAAEVMRLLALIERHTKDTAVSTDDLVDLQESA